MQAKNSSRSRIIGLRLTPQEYDQVEKKLRSTTAKKLSEYIRQILFDQPVTVYQRNQSLDYCMAEMIALRNELKNVGNNFNQAVKKLHTPDQIVEFKIWILTYEAEKKILLNKVEEIKNHTKGKRSTSNKKL